MNNTDILTAPAVIEARHRRILADRNVFLANAKQDLKVSLTALSISTLMLLLAVTGGVYAFSDVTVIRAIVGVYAFCMAGIFGVFITSEFGHLTKAVKAVNEARAFTA